MIPISLVFVAALLATDPPALPVGTEPVAREAGPATAKESEPRDGVRLFDKGDPEYIALSPPPRSRIYPEATSRLVFFLGGAPILDRGLRSGSSSAAPTRPGEHVETAEDVVETAVTSPDDRFGVVLSTRVQRAAASPGQAGASSDSPSLSTEISWVDTANPEGLWSVSLEQGRFVRDLALLSAGRGVAVITLADPDSPADVRIYGPEGIELTRLDESDGSALSLSATSHGAFLAVDLAYPNVAELPSRGVTVFDLLHGTRWTYTWKYGASDEPMSWRLDDTGVLEVVFPGKSRAFDRNGKPLKKWKRR